MFKRGMTAGALVASGMLTACVVVTPNYAVPEGAPTATLTFELVSSDAARVGQQIVFLDDEVAMTNPVIYGLQNGDVAGPERAGNQFAGRPELVEANRKLFVFAKTTLPSWNMNNRYCLGQFSFTPAVGHAYVMRQATDDQGCVLIIQDRATGAAPPDLQRHDADRVILPF